MTPLFKSLRLALYQHDRARIVELDTFRDNVKTLCEHYRQIRAERLDTQPELAGNPLLDAVEKEVQP